MFFFLSTLWSTKMENKCSEFFLCNVWSHCIVSSHLTSNLALYLYVSTLPLMFELTATKYGTAFSGGTQIWGLKKATKNLLFINLLSTLKYTDRNRCR